MQTEPISTKSNSSKRRSGKYRRSYKPSRVGLREIAKPRSKTTSNRYKACGPKARRPKRKSGRIKGRISRVKLS